MCFCAIRSILPGVITALILREDSAYTILYYDTNLNLRSMSRFLFAYLKCESRAGLLLLYSSLLGLAFSKTRLK